MKRPVQVKKSAISTSRQRHPSRTATVSTQQEEHVRNIPSQTENAERFGHSLDNISVSPNTVTSSSGSPLPEPLQRKMETSFGHDLSDVRIHEDSQAPSLGAAAYTRGTEIHFAPGMYQPHSLEGQAMIGHELTHVVQQRIGRVKPASANGINTDHALENEADTAGTKAAQGNQIDVSGSHSNGSSATSGSAVQMLSLSSLKPSDERKKALKKYGLNLLKTGASGAGSVLSSVLGAALKGGSSGDIFNAFKESGTKAAGTLGSSALSGIQGVLHPGQADAKSAGAATPDASTASATTPSDTSTDTTTADTPKDTGATATNTEAATTDTGKTDTPAATSTGDTKTQTGAGTSNAESKIEELKPWKPALQQIIKIIDS